jgi:hypothetical protein
VWLNLQENLSIGWFHGSPPDGVGRERTAFNCLAFDDNNEISVILTGSRHFFFLSNQKII